MLNDSALRHSQTNSEAIAGVGIGGALEPEAHSTAGIARHIKIIASATYGTRICRDNIEFFMAPLRIKVIQYNFPDAATHVGHTKAVPASLLVLIHR